MNRCTFPKTIRLRRKAEFDAVFDGKLFAADDVLVMHSQKNQLDFTRLGLSIGKKVGNAVVRNRWKRLIRESFRRQQHDLPTGLDLVIRPRKGGDCELKKISRSINGLANRLARKLGQAP